MVPRFRVHRHSVITGLVMLALPLISLGQSRPSFDLEKEMRWTVQDRISELQSYSNLSRESRKEDFKELFAKDAQHVVDFPMLNQKDTTYLSIDEYVETYVQLFEGRRRFELELLQIKTQGTFPNLTLQTTVLKSFKGATAPHEWRFENAEFTQHITIDWQCQNLEEVLDYINPTQGDEKSRSNRPRLDLKITSIHRSQSQPEYFTLLVDETGLEAEIVCGGLRFPSGNPNLAIYYNTDDVWILRDINGRIANSEISAVFPAISEAKNALNPITLNQPNRRKPFSWTADVGSGFLMKGNLLSTNLSEYELGARSMRSAEFAFGYAPVQDHQRIFDVYTSISINQQQINLDIPHLQVSTSAIDPDGFQYLRLSEATNWTEEMNEQVVSLGFGGRFFSRLFSNQNKRVFYTGIQAGLQLGIAQENSFSSSSDVLHAGYYDELSGITIDENGIYDFGEHLAQGSSPSSWRQAFACSLHGMLGYKVDEKSANMIFISAGPSLNMRKSNMPTDSFFDSFDVLNSGIQASERLRLSVFSVNLGIRKRIGWDASTPCNQ